VELFKILYPPNNIAQKCIYNIYRSARVYTIDVKIIFLYNRTPYLRMINILPKLRINAMRIYCFNHIITKNPPLHPYIDFSAKTTKGCTAFYVEDLIIVYKVITYQLTHVHSGVCRSTSWKPQSYCLSRDLIIADFTVNRTTVKKTFDLRGIDRVQCSPPETVDRLSRQVKSLTCQKGWLCWLKIIEIPDEHFHETGMKIKLVRMHTTICVLMPHVLKNRNIVWNV